MTTRVVITIDTEPDNQWEMPSPGAGPPPLGFDNTRNLGRLSEFLRSLGTPATWLTSYSVARDAESARQLRRAAAEGDEIGGHLHAWETPPLTDADHRAHPYIYEHEPEVRLAKLRTLNAALEDSVGIRPVSYRAGRWGIDEREYEHLAQLGYRIDTSVVPGYDFTATRGLERGGPDFRCHLRGKPPAPFRVGSIWEVPVSVATLGLLGGGAGAPAGARLSRGLSSHRPAYAARAAGRILSLAGISRMVWVRPLVHPRADLVRAAVALLRRRAVVINIMFHSSEAHEGTSPRTREAGAVQRLFGDIEAIVEALREAGDVTPCTLRDAVSPQ